MEPSYHNLSKEAVVTVSEETLQSLAIPEEDTVSSTSSENAPAPVYPTYQFKNYINYAKYNHFVPENQSALFHCATDHVYDELSKFIAQYGSISPSGSYMDTPTSIKLELKPHQKRTLYEMVKREDSEVRLNAHNLFILADNVGSGKSLSMLSLIASRPTVRESPRHVQYVPRMASARSEKDILTAERYANNCYHIPSNLLVVPHGIFHQWKQYVSRYTQLKCIFIGTSKDIDAYIRTPSFEKGSTQYAEAMVEEADRTLGLLNASQIILIKSTFYKEFLRKLDNLVGYKQLRVISPIERIEANEEYNYTLDENHPEYILDYVQREYGKFNTRFSNGNFYSFDTFLEKLALLQSKINLDRCKDLVSVNACPRVRTYFKSIVFERLIIDEADSIQVACFNYPVSKVVWMISSSVYNLLYPSGRRSFSYEEPEASSSSSSASSHSAVAPSTLVVSKGIRTVAIRYHVLDILRNYADAGRYSKFRLFTSIVKNQDAFIRDSITLPDPVSRYINCYTPRQIYAVEGAVSSEILTALNAGDIQSALGMLGMNSGSQDDLVNAVTKQLQKRKRTLEVNIQEKERVILQKQEEIKRYQAELRKMRSLNGTSIPEESAEDDSENEPHESPPPSESSESSSLAPVVIPSEVNPQDLLNAKKESIKAEMHSLRILISSANQSIKSFQEQIREIDNKIRGVQDRIQIRDEDNCPICADSFKNPCLVPCCNNVFCLECIHLSMKHAVRKNTCPMCRAAIDINQLRIITETKGDSKEADDSKDGTNEEKLLTKLERLMLLIQESEPSRRFLVFSEFDNTFHEIHDELTAHRVSFSRLSGSSAHIRKVVEMYRMGKIKVLLLNARNFGAGLNLECTDEMIVYHRMGLDMERQIVGRAQRMGRLDPLLIHYLCFENEYTASQQTSASSSSGDTSSIDDDE